MARFRADQTVHLCVSKDDGKIQAGSQWKVIMVYKDDPPRYQCKNLDGYALIFREDELCSVDEISRAE